MSSFLHQSLAATLLIVTMIPVLRASQHRGSAEAQHHAVFPGRTPGSPRPAEGLSIARAYLSGLNTGHLAALDRLFLPGGRSSILENASDEGSWEHYRDHHLKPEMESAINFKFNVTDEKSERFESTLLVRQVGEFTVQVGEEARAYRAAITYVIIEDAGELRIAHLHWSSRRQQKK